MGATAAGRRCSVDQYLQLLWSEVAAAMIVRYLAHACGIAKVSRVYLAAGFDGFEVVSSRLGLIMIASSLPIPEPLYFDMRVVYRCGNFVGSCDAFFYTVAPRM